MAGRPWFGNGCQLGVGVDVTRATAISQLAEVVGQALDGLLVRIGFERVGMATAASRPVRRELPRSLVRIGRMAHGTAGSAFVIAGILGRRMSKCHHRPVGVVVARGAIDRRRHVVGDFSGRGPAVVTALTIDCEAGVIELGRGPRQRAMACAAVLGDRHVVVRQARSANAGVAGTTGTAAHGAASEFGAHGDAVVIQADRNKSVGRMTGTAVVVARDVSRVLAHGFHAVVTTEAGATYQQVVHTNDRQEVVLGMAGFAVVLRENMSHGPGS